MGEQVQILLHCQKCGSSGVALWEKSSASNLREVRKLLSLSEGFYQRPLIGTAGTTEIICDHCGTGLRN